MTKLSIIVPVYNVEKYLRQCIDSILLQTMTDYEIILVDDGSLDKSGVICDEYAANHKNVRAFHKKNGGLSDARNFGILKAEGDYLIFIDSDDFYDDANFFQQISDTIDSNNELVLMNFMRKRYFESTNDFDTNIKSFDVKHLNEIVSYEELLKYLISTDGLMISACFKVIKRSYILEKKLFFKTGLVAEDIEWSMRLFSEKFNMKFINNDPYVYRSGRKGSITNTMGLKNLNDLYYIISKYADEFVDSKDSVKELLLNYIAYQYAILCGLIVRLPDKRERKEFTKMMAKYKWLLKYNISPKVKKVSQCVRFLGLSMTIKMLGFYIGHRR